MGLRWAGRLLFLTTIILITDLALQPGFATPPSLLGSDKVEHIAAFFTLAMLARLGWPSFGWLVSGTILAAYGLGIEYLQSLDFVGRTASWADFVADLIGITLGFVTLRILAPRRPAPGE